jgi:hypothetical protein
MPMPAGKINHSTWLSVTASASAVYIGAAAKAFWTLIRMGRAAVPGFVTGARGEPPGRPGTTEIGIALPNARHSRVRRLAGRRLAPVA